MEFIFYQVEIANYLITLISIDKDKEKKHREIECRAIEREPVGHIIEGGLVISRGDI